MKYSYVLCLLLLFSCGNKKQLSKDYELLQSAPISFPVTAQIVYDGRDTVIDDFYNATLKQVIFVDSLDCSPCFIKGMNSWAPLLDYSAGLDNVVKYYFIFSPKAKDLWSVKSNLKSLVLDYPVIIDIDQEFIKTNSHIPKNKLFHSFLLDSANNVVLVGDPSRNEKVRDLFYRKTQETYRELKK